MHSQFHKKGNTKSVTLFTNGKRPRTIRLDREMVNIVTLLATHQFIEVLGCCCGHEKYPMTIVVKNKEGKIWEVFSGKTIPRKRRFYERNDEGLYFIPETLK